MYVNIVIQGSDERVSSRNKACVIIASVLARGQVRKTVQIIALLRWRRATVLSASPDSSTVIGGNVSSEGLGGDKEEALPRWDAGDEKICTVFFVV